MILLRQVIKKGLPVGLRNVLSHRRPPRRHALVETVIACAERDFSCGAQLSGLLPRRASKSYASSPSGEVRPPWRDITSYRGHFLYGDVTSCPRSGHSAITAEL